MVLNILLVVSIIQMTIAVYVAFYKDRQGGHEERETYNRVREQQLKIKELEYKINRTYRRMQK